MNLEYESKVDVVPVINVSLVVVLTLMLISPFLNNTVEEVDLPEAYASEVEDQENLEITFTLDQKIFVGEEEVAFADLRPFLTQIFDANPEAMAVVKADQKLLYGEVEKLIAEVEAANAPRIAIATRQRTEEGEG
jgi:biopolymer transport protein ExbD